MKANVAEKAVHGRGILNVGQIFRTRKTRTAVLLFVSAVALFKAVDLYAGVQYERYLDENNAGANNSWLGWKEYMSPCSSQEGCWFGRQILHENGIGRYGERGFVVEVESWGWFKRRRFLDNSEKPIQKSDLIKPSDTW